MKNPSEKPTSLPRRDFLKSASTFGAGLMVVPSYVVGKSPTQLAPSNRVNIAMVGLGGRGLPAYSSLIEENFVAFCDVESDTSAWYSAKKFTEKIAHQQERIKNGTRLFKDYREMLTEMGDKIDAVVISTPDHMHYPIAKSAINLGKHVYVEKPLSHTVWEARDLAESAKKAGIISAMGNQGHSNSGARSVVEWVQAGVIGDIREVHSWTNRPVWPQGQGLPDHSEGSPPVPGSLDWNLWLGIAASRGYDPAYVPFKWRGYFDFGSGAFGDMACHIMDSAYWSLNLDYPDWLEASSSQLSECCFPKSSVVTYHFPERDGRPEVLYKWYDGGMFPPRPKMIPEEEAFGDRSGTYIVGEHACIVCDTYSGSVKISPRSKFMELRTDLPAKTLRRIKTNHHTEWANAIREGRKASSDFEYSGPFTEMVQLGNIALRARTRLEFDSAKMEFINHPQANALLGKTYPDGWVLG